MRKRHAFWPSVDALEGRLALSGMALHHAVHVAAAGTDPADEVDQVGDHPGQFGDQTSPDGTGSSEQDDNERDDDGTAGAGTVVTNKISKSINGSLTGTARLVTPVTDIGRTFKLSGSGRLQTLGTVQETGSVRSTGFIKTGRSTGRLVLSNSRGTATLALTGPMQRGNLPLPGSYRFVITSGTGAFKSLTGSGTIAATWQPSASAPQQFTMTLRSG